MAAKSSRTMVSTRWRTRSPRSFDTACRRSWQYKSNPTAVEMAALREAEDVPRAANLEVA